MKLEGLPRHASTHAAGVVIGDRPLDELVPLYRDPRSDMPVTQFDMKYVEAAGLVKFDFLGLKTLSVLKEGERLLAEQGVRSISTRCPGTIRRSTSFSSAATRSACSSWNRKACGARLRRSARPASATSSRSSRSTARARWTTFRCSATARTAARRSNIRTRCSRACSTETYGIFVYQEQVMQAAQVLAGYSLGEADLLRRAMGKKIKSEMDAQRARFVEGCAEHNIIPAAKANELFDLIDKFAGYGFNKSHAAAYALVAYQTAWLKAHHRAEFYAASMSFDMALTDKLGIVRRGHAARRGRVPAARHQRQPGRISRSRTAPVRYALGALKGVGEKAMEALVDEREATGRSRPSRISPPGSIRGCSIAARSKASPAAGAFDAIARIARRSSLRPRRSSPMPPARTTSATSGQAACSAAKPAEVAPIRLPRDGRWTLRSAWRRSETRSASISRRTRSIPRGICSRRTRPRHSPSSADVPIAEGERARRAHGGAGRGRPLAHVGQGPPLHDGDAERPSGQFEATRLRR